ncbi:MAG: alkaline phosphatase family protein [Rhizobiaceae bacterium]|nr:alkaline phosphatase family protein [Rhizobiaceae bacterium]
MPATVGPILYARGSDADGCRLSALVATSEGKAPPALTVAGRVDVLPRRLAELFGRTLWLYDFVLPADGKAAYTLGSRTFDVAADLTGDVRLAFVSCNGQEDGDGKRELGERDAMWAKLSAEHEAAPFSLLLQGGDQLYADEILQSHPETWRWFRLTMRRKGGVAFSGEMRQAARRYLAGRYLTLMAQPAIAHMVARVPSLMMWDDHDIIDGWGSHPERMLDSPVGKGIFEVAREMFALFQLGSPADAPPAYCPDRTGRNYSLAARFPGFSVIAPDLRSERRPKIVMGETGWKAHEQALDETPEGDRILLVSSVPALGPRLSLVELAIDWFPKAQKYEDDLRDQWQSRVHRAEWQRFLLGLETRMVEHRSPVTLLSGEIHLATRGEMTLRDGQVMHQFVASGIAHPKPPRAYAMGLGALARFGEAPLPGRPIRLKPLPGKLGTYTAERNYLVLTRAAGQWSAAWELEDSGRTAEIAA